jgi:hypothetical protein
MVSRAGDLSATALLTARCRGASVVGSLPLGTRFIRECAWTWIQGFYEFAGALAVVRTATTKTFSARKGKATEGYSPERCG